MVAGRQPGADTIFVGHCHGHPYGEIDLVIPVDDAVELDGPGDWQGLGWVCAARDTLHFLKVRNGALMTLNYMPAGRILYQFDPAEIRARRGGA